MFTILCYGYTQLTIACTPNKTEKEKEKEKEKDDEEEKEKEEEEDNIVVDLFVLDLLDTPLPPCGLLRGVRWHLYRHRHHPNWIRLYAYHHIHTHVMIAFIPDVMHEEVTCMSTSTWSWNHRGFVCTSHRGCLPTLERVHVPQLDTTVTWFAHPSLSVLSCRNMLVHWFDNQPHVHTYTNVLDTTWFATVYRYMDTQRGCTDSFVVK